MLVVVLDGRSVSVTVEVNVFELSIFGFSDFLGVEVVHVININGSEVRVVISSFRFVSVRVEKFSELGD